MYWSTSAASMLFTSSEQSTSPGCGRSGTGPKHEMVAPISVGGPRSGSAPVNVTLSICRIVSTNSSQVRVTETRSPVNVLCSANVHVSETLRSTLTAEAVAH